MNLESFKDTYEKCSKKGMTHDEIMELARKSEIPEEVIQEFLLNQNQGGKNKKRFLKLLSIAFVIFLVTVGYGYIKGFISEKNNQKSLIEQETVKIFEEVIQDLEDIKETEEGTISLQGLGLITNLLIDIAVDLEEKKKSGVIKDYNIKKEDLHELLGRDLEDFSVDKYVTNGKKFFIVGCRRYHRSGRDIPQIIEEQIEGEWYVYVEGSFPGRTSFIKDFLGKEDLASVKICSESGVDMSLFSSDFTHYTIGHRPTE